MLVYQPLLTGSSEDPFVKNELERIKSLDRLLFKTVSETFWILVLVLEHTEPRCQ